MWAKYIFSLPWFRTCMGHVEKKSGCIPRFPYSYLLSFPSHLHGAYCLLGKIEKQQYHEDLPGTEYKKSEGPTYLGCRVKTELQDQGYRDEGGWGIGSGLSMSEEARGWVLSCIVMGGGGVLGGNMHQLAWRCELGRETGMDRAQLGEWEPWCTWSTGSQSRRGRQ